MTQRQPIPAVPFAQAWTLADTAAYVKAQGERPENDHQAMAVWRDKVNEPLDEKVRLSAAGHIAWLAQEGRFTPPAHSKVFHLNWLWALDAVLTANTEFPWPQMAVEPFRMALDFELDGLARSVLEKKITLESAHEQWIAFVEAGDFPAYLSDASECFSTGERVKAVSSGWRFELQIRRGRGYVPVADGMVKAPGIEHFEIDLPSGELWINDWFRVRAFTELAQEAARGLPSINSEAGSLAQTRAYAEKLGFVSVSSGNTCPSVVVDEGRVLIGCVSEEGHRSLDGKIAGSVCTDLWWSTMIDKQVLLELVSRSMPAEEAERQIAEMAKEYAHTMTVLHLPPGRYHLYCAGGGETFNRDFDMQEVSLAPFRDAMCVLSPAPLTPRLAASAQSESSASAAASQSSAEHPAKPRARM